MKNYILYLFMVLALVAKADELPNVLYIIVDQHSGLMTTQAGYDIATPGVDKIAEDGTVFTRSYCSYPVCTSARKTFLTGQMPSKAADVTTHVSIGTQFKNQGYETVFYGKWHVGSTHMDDEGVDVWHGFDTYTDARVDSDIYQWSSDFLKGEHTKPFFMITSFLNPHDCCELARNIAGEDDSYHDGAVEENADTAICPALPSNFAIPENEPEGFYTRRNNEPGENYWDSQPTKLWTEVEWRQYMYGYDRLVEKVDQHVENLYDDLVNQGLLDNTIIIYTSDHGDGHGSHAWTQKKSFYEETVNVPLIISWKGKIYQDSINSNTLVSGLDIYPTLLSMVGITPPSDLPGKDLSPALLASAESSTIDRDYVVSEMNQKAYTGNTPGNFIGRTVITSDYKYILFDKGVNREMLFDVKNDPDELYPVMDDEAYKTVLDECRTLLKDWVQTNSDEIDVDAVIAEYEGDAKLDAVLFNGVKIDNFDPTVDEQALYVVFDDAVNISATPVNSEATIVITQPTDLTGDEAERTVTISVESEDKTSNKSYSILLNEKPEQIEIGFVNADLDVPLDGWSEDYVLISEKINGPGNHGTYTGNAALKFVRGQSDKAGYLETSLYENLDSISFWMYVYEPVEEAATLTLEKVNESGVKTLLTTISSTQLSADVWTEFKIAINTDEPVKLLFTPSLPVDGDTRLWIDDMTLIFNNEVETSLFETFNDSQLLVYPNPCKSVLNLKGDINGNVAIYDITGELMLSYPMVSSTRSIDVSSLDNGIHILEITGEKTYTQHFIKGE